MRLRTSLALVPWALLASSASAAPITPAAFGGTQIVENFEGIAAGSNVSTSAFGNILLPGSTSDYAFASGVTLAGPNPGLFANGAFLHDAAAAGATNNWGANGSVSNGAQVPDPFGLASTTYLGSFDNLGAGSSFLDLRFSSDQLRVGAWVAGAAGSSITIEAYDASGALLEALTLAAPSVSAWGTSFLGLERSEGIRRVVIRGADFGIDGLSFEASSAVAEPSIALLGSAGLLGLWWMGGRRARTIAFAPSRA